VWTSNAHHAHYLIGLFRTLAVDQREPPARAHQFVVDMKTPGITVNPIYQMTASTISRGGVPGRASCR
jgi:acyl-CoA dehydrogenase